MHPTKKLRVLLFLSGLLAIVIGSSLLLAPAQFHATNGIEIAADPNLLSEVRAPGGNLLVLGLLMLVGVFVRAFTIAATAIGAAVYLSYGGARLLSVGLDGVPGPGLVAATAIELSMGALCALALARLAGTTSSSNARLVEVL